MIGLVLAALAWVSLTQFGKADGGGPSHASGVVERASDEEICIHDEGCFEVNTDHGVEIPSEGACVELDLARPTMDVIRVRSATCTSS